MLGLAFDIIATNHQIINYQELADWSACIVDTRNAMAGGEDKIPSSLENIDSRKTGSRILS
jgi:hypothetical protein